MNQSFDDAMRCDGRDQRWRKRQIIIAWIAQLPGVIIPHLYRITFHSLGKTWKEKQCRRFEFKITPHKLTDTQTDTWKNNAISLKLKCWGFQCFPLQGWLQPLHRTEPEHELDHVVSSTLIPCSSPSHPSILYWIDIQKTQPYQIVILLQILCCNIWDCDERDKDNIWY